MYTWHLSLRVDRPVEGCTLRPHAYMYSKKLDERDFDKPLPPHSKKCRDPPPHHEFVYRWFRGPRSQPCAYEGCTRRTSFSPHDWSRHALGGTGACSLQCVSRQSSLYRATFCNSMCFKNAWKTQRTVAGGNQRNPYSGGMMTMGSGGGGAVVQSGSSGGAIHSPPPQDRGGGGGYGGGSTGNRRRVDSAGLPDDMSVGSVGSGPPLQLPPSAGGVPATIGKYLQNNNSSSEGTGGITPTGSGAPGGGSSLYRATLSMLQDAGHHVGGVDAGGVGSLSAPSTPTGSSSNPYSRNTSSFNDAASTGSGPPDVGGGGGDGMGGSSTLNSNADPYLAGVNNGGNNNNAGTDDEWMEVNQLQYFLPTDLDVGRKLQVEATAIAVETGEILMQRIVKTDLVLARAPEPVKRNLITAANGKDGGGGRNASNASANSAGNAASGVGGGARFRIVTYNVLAEIYATQQQYPYCDFWALNWDYRFQNILKELLDVGPDILCLQEVQADHYADHIYQSLSDVGFDGVYKQKTRQSMGLAGKVDGCALFWRRSKFHLVETYSIEFNELAQRQATQVMGFNPRSEDSVAYLNRLSRDNIAQLVVLELVNPTPPTRSNREPINQVCIANTHLYSHKDYPDVKLWQTWQLLTELESFVMSRVAPATLPLMICGDFNSTPDTAVYTLLSQAQVHPRHPDVNLATADDTIPNVLPDASMIGHSFQLGSVYHTVVGEEPRWTNYTTSFRGTLDYMWYTASLLRPLSCAPIPEEEELTRHGEALPNTQYSSDHMMLISDMQIMYGPRGGPPP